MKAARFLACAFLAVTALDAAHSAAQQSVDPSAEPPPVTDPLAKELDRCRVLNEKAASDARCEAAYKESRQQFFQPPEAYTPVPVHMNPGTPVPKLVKPGSTEGK